MAAFKYGGDLTVMLSGGDSSATQSPAARELGEVGAQRAVLMRDEDPTPVYDNTPQPDSASLQLLQRLQAKEAEETASTTRANASCDSGLPAPLPSLVPTSRICGNTMPWSINQIGEG